MKLGVPVVPSALFREGKGPNHILEIGKPIYPDSSLLPEEAEAEVTQKYTKVFEDIISRNPELYWWSHRRWKTTGMYGNGKHEIPVTDSKGNVNEE